ncbi:branched-chain amino acid transaminase [Candidatus Saganbacteria bacterium]|nr:branched-chain amino acid transaminase [Candidatus Saganbacteria bacterium]
MKFAYFEGKIVPFKEANISIMTHAFNYGTGVFEGIRAYWNADQGQMLILKLKEHYGRLQKSAAALRIKLKYSLDDLIDITVAVVKQNGYHEDIYIRPIAYKSQEKIGLGLTGVEDNFCLFISPFGAYLDIEKGIRVCISSWRRIGAQSMPQGAKITGAYFNSSLAKAEAMEKGLDEAILLSPDGTVAEGSGENLFLLENDKLITPPLREVILPGITRRAVIELARQELKLEVVERLIKKEELFSAAELFFCGTGAQISAITEVDGAKIGGGFVGPVTKKLQAVYFKAVRGDAPKYADWITPVY